MITAEQQEIIDRSLAEFRAKHQQPVIDFYKEIYRRLSESPENEVRREVYFALRQWYTASRAWHGAKNVITIAKAEGPDYVGGI
jgi:DNA-binding FadR family transcriptional regulator